MASLESPRPLAVPGKLAGEHKTAPRYDTVPSRPAHHPGDLGSRRHISQSYAKKELQVSDTFQQIQVGTWHQLVSALSIQFDDEVIYQIPTGKFGPPDGPHDVLITSGSINGPGELHVLPEVLTIGPHEEMFVFLMCVDLPWFLHKGATIAQAFLLPKDLECIPEDPVAYWTEVVGPNKSIVRVSLLNKGTKLYLTGMTDTRADVTFISHSRQSQDWELTSPSGTVLGTRGATASMRSKYNIVVEGPEGQVVTIQPFILKSGFTLWGRDPLSQCGGSARNPISILGFLVRATVECTTLPLTWKTDNPVWVDQCPFPGILFLLRGR